MKVFVLASLLLGGCYIHAAPAAPAEPVAIAAADPKAAEEEEEAYAELYEQAEAQLATPPEEAPGELDEHDGDGLD